MWLEGAIGPYCWLLRCLIQLCRPLNRFQMFASSASWCPCDYHTTRERWWRSILHGICTTRGNFDLPWHYGHGTEGHSGYRRNKGLSSGVEYRHGGRMGDNGLRVGYHCTCRSRCALILRWTKINHSSQNANECFGIRLTCPKFRLRRPMIWLRRCRWVRK